MCLEVYLGWIFVKLLTNPEQFSAPGLSSPLQVESNTSDPVLSHFLARSGPVPGGICSSISQHQWALRQDPLRLSPCHCSERADARH